MTKQFHPVRYLPRLDIKLSNGVELFNGGERERERESNFR